MDIMSMQQKSLSQPHARVSRSDPATRRGRGFTLIETMLTAIIVGLAISALVKQVLVSTQQNRFTQRMTTGSFLANNVREMMAGLPFNDPSAGTTTFGPESG